MKRLYTLLIALIAMTAAGVAQRAGSVEIDETHFPDENFREYVYKFYDANHNNVFEQEELAAVKRLYISSSGITNLNGIEYFTKLEELHCHGNRLTALDVSANTALKVLYCYGNKLTALDLSKNTALEILNCSDNQLTSLDVLANTALRNLQCSDNQLTELDLSANTLLEYLFCPANQLTKLDVSGSTALRELNCERNKLSGNAMTALVSSLCDRTATDAGKLRILKLTDPSDDNICTMEQVAIATGKNWSVSAYNGNTNGYETYAGYDFIPVGGIEINATNFRDVNFRYFVANTYDKIRDNFLSKAELDAVTTMELPDGQIADLKGIGFFTKLETLHCSDNQLTALEFPVNTKLKNLFCNNNRITALDVSTNTALEKLKCSGNRLTALDLSANTKLKELSCDNNLLTALDVSANTALERIYCNANKLISLDVSKNTNLSSLICSFNALTALDLKANTALQSLDCSDNALTALDVTGCAALETVYCEVNKLSGDAMTALINSLCDRTATDAGTISLFAYPNDREENVCTTAQVAVIKGKNWKVQAWNVNAYSYEEYAGSEPTAIRNVETSDGTASAAGWYGIDGKKLPAEPTQRGIYIHGGRKVVK